MSEKDVGSESKDSSLCLAEDPQIETVYQAHDVFVAERMKKFDLEAFLKMPLPGIGSPPTVRPSSAVPWAIYQIPPVRGSEKLKAMCDPKKLEKAAKKVMTLSKEEIASLQDRQDPSSLLMRLLAYPEDIEKNIEFILPLATKLYGSNLLGKQVDQGIDAIYYACVKFPTRTYIPGYIAALYMKANIIIVDRLYGPEHSSILQVLCQHGDYFLDVIKELMYVSETLHQPVFNVNRRNKLGKTAIEIAIENHGLLITDGRKSTLKIVELLMQEGADVSIIKYGMSLVSRVILLSADVKLVKLLLEGHGKEVINSRSDIRKETALHKVAAKKGITAPNKLLIWKMLIEAGADPLIVNVYNKRAVQLLSNEEKTTFGLL